MYSKHYRHIPDPRHSTSLDQVVDDDSSARGNYYNAHHCHQQQRVTPPPRAAESESPRTPNHSSSTTAASSVSAKPILKQQSPFVAQERSGAYFPRQLDTSFSSIGYRDYQHSGSGSAGNTGSSGAGRYSAGARRTGIGSLSQKDSISLETAAIVMDIPLSSQSPSSSEKTKAAPAPAPSSSPPLSAPPPQEPLYKYNLPPPANRGPKIPASTSHYRPIRRPIYSPPPRTVSIDPSLTLPPIRSSTAQQPSVSSPTLEPSVAAMPTIYDYHHHHPHHHDQHEPPFHQLPPPSTPPPPPGYQTQSYTPVAHTPHSPTFPDSYSNPSDHGRPHRQVGPDYPIIHTQLLQLIASGLLTGAAGTQNPEAILVSPLAVRVSLSDNDATQLCSLPFFGSFTHRELTAQAQLLVGAIIDSSVEETVPYSLKEELQPPSSRSSRKKNRRHPLQPRWWTRMENAALLARMLIEDSRASPQNSLWSYVKWGLEACWKQHQTDGTRDGGEKAGIHINLGDELDWLLQVNSAEAWGLVQSGNPTFAINARHRHSRTPTASSSPGPMSPNPSHSRLSSHHSGTASPGVIPQSPPYSREFEYPQSHSGEYYAHSPDVHRQSHYPQYPDYDYYQTQHHYHQPTQPSAGSPSIHNERVVTPPENTKPPPSPSYPNEQQLPAYSARQTSSRRVSHPLSNCETLESVTITSETSAHRVPEPTKKNDRDHGYEDDGIL